MQRIVLALILAVTTLSLTPDLSAARPAVRTTPASQATCSFSEGLARFRDVLGEEVVGDCLAEQHTNEQGYAAQATTEGALYWDGRRGSASFHNGAMAWIDGPLGIGSDVTVGGLSDRLTERAPVTMPALLALEYSSLSPEDAGEGWRYARIKKTFPRLLSLPCSPEQPETMIGALQVWLFEPDSGHSIRHTLIGYQSAGGPWLRERLNQVATDCDGWSVQTPTGLRKWSLAVQPVVELDGLGDEAMFVDLAIEHEDPDTRATGRYVQVRYGGLLSIITVSRRDVPDRETEHQELVSLAKLANSRIQEVALVPTAADRPGPRRAPSVR